MGKEINKDYWESQYQANDLGWDIGYASPPLSYYIDQLPPKEISILIPGCGNGYEASYLLDHGFTNVTVIDISPTLTSALEEKFKDHLGKEINVVTGDFFELKGSFDLVLEQTFLCALPPSLRNSYRDKMFQILKPGGKIAGVVFNKIFEEEGPPFGATRKDYEELFADKFRIKTMEECYNSIGRRMGNEFFIILEVNK